MAVTGAGATALIIAVIVTAATSAIDAVVTGAVTIAAISLKRILIQGFYEDFFRIVISSQSFQL
jgi:hypothetical protein